MRAEAAYKSVINMQTDGNGGAERLPLGALPLVTPWQLRFVAVDQLYSSSRARRHQPSMLAAERLLLLTVAV